MRGLVFGDGHRDGRGSSIELYESKMQLVHHFAGCRVLGPRHDGVNTLLTVNGLPAYYKDEPRSQG